jgi:hypothetical protein
MASWLGLDDVAVAEPWRGDLAGSLQAALRARSTETDGVDHTGADPRRALT